MKKFRSNVLTDRSLTCRTLSMVASALSRVYGVEVTTSGTEAFTVQPEAGNASRINIPALELEDSNYLTLVRGYIDHEVGHVRFTKWNKAARPDATALLRALWNILEDPFVEYKIGLCYMGCQRNLRDLNRTVFNADSIESIACGNIEDATMIFHNYTLLKVRSMLDAEHFDPLLSELRSIGTAWGVAHIFDDIDKILADAKYSPQTTDTDKNVDVAHEIFELLKNKTSTMKKFSKGVADNAPGHMDNDNLDTVRERLKKALSDKHGGNTLAKGVSTSDAASKAISKITSKVTSDNKIPHGDPDFASGAGTGRGNGYYVRKLSSNDKDAALRVRATLDLKLRSLLQNYIMARGGAAEHGKLDYRKLHRLAVNNPRIFQHKVEKRGINTEVIVLCDISGSMCGSKATMTSQALYALMTSLVKIPGVKAGAYGFNSSDFECFVPLGGRVTDVLNLSPSGGTLMGEAVNRCMSLFSYDDNSRQVLIILSDGDSHNTEYCSAMLEKAHNIGIDIAAIGIMDSYMSSFQDVADVRIITDLNELAPALFSILQRKLVDGGL